MKNSIRFLQIISLFQFLSSCGEMNGKQNVKENPKDSVTAIPDTVSSLPVTDTTSALLTPESCFEMKSISKNEYERLRTTTGSNKSDLLSETRYPEQFFSLIGLSNIKKAFVTMEEDALKGNKRILRKGDILVVKGDKKEHRFVNRFENFYPEYPDSLENNYTIEEFYIYDGKLKLSGIDCICAMYYEGRSYFLADASGTIFEVCGYPEESPDGKHLFCSNTDLVAGFSANGFNILEVKNGILVRKCEVFPEDYGLEMARWIGNDVIIAKKIISGSGDGNTDGGFVKITLK
ncbi:MAG: hypothetical protein ACOZCO_03140 [Bacteroidota bacterium]